MKTLILIIMSPTPVFVPSRLFGQYAIEVPEGYEIVSQTQDRIEINTSAYQSPPGNQNAKIYKYPLYLDFPWLFNLPSYSL